MPISRLQTWSLVVDLTGWTPMTYACCRLDSVSSSTHMTYGTASTGSCYRVHLMWLSNWAASSSISSWFASGERCAQTDLLSRDSHFVADVAVFTVSVFAGLASLSRSTPIVHELIAEHRSPAGPLGTRPDLTLLHHSQAQNP